MSHHVPLISLRIVRERTVKYNHAFDREEAFASLARLIIGDMDREGILVIHTNVQHKPIGMELIAIGQVGQCMVHPREVFKSAILNGATNIVLAHNHPSGDKTPSQADIELTKRLIQAGEIIGIGILDHLVITDDDHSSLRSGGLCSGWENRDSII